MSAAAIEQQMDAAVQDFVKTLKGLAEAHVVAKRSELATREKAVEDRVRQLNKLEDALAKRAATLSRRESTDQTIAPEPAQQQAPVSKPEISALPRAPDLTALNLPTPVFGQAAEGGAGTATSAESPMEHESTEPEPGTVEARKALFKGGLPDRVKAALQAPSPSRARPFSATGATRSGSVRAILRSTPPPPTSSACVAQPRSPRGSATKLTIPPASPPVATEMASPSPDDTPCKANVVAERKEMLLKNLTKSAFEPSPGGDDSFVNNSLLNASVVSTPGRGSNAGRQLRRSLMELLQEDEARLGEQVRTLQ